MAVLERVILRLLHRPLHNVGRMEELYMWLEHGFNLTLFRTSSRNKARTKPCGP